MLDTRLKNNHKKRNIIAVVGLLVITIVTMCLFPIINRDAESRVEKMAVDVEQEMELDEDLFQNIYEGCYVLYAEMMQYQGQQTASDIYLEVSYKGSDEDKRNMVEDLRNYVDETLASMSRHFEDYRAEIDYCILLENGEYEKNTSQPLEEIGNLSKEEETILNEYYNNYLKLCFDERGALTVEPIYSTNVDDDTLIKTFGQWDRSDVWGTVVEEYENSGITCNQKKPTNFTVIFAIPKDSQYQFFWNYNESGVDFWVRLNAYKEAGAGCLYIGALTLSVCLVLILTSKRIWKDTIDMTRPGNWYLAEAAITGAICEVCFYHSFIEMIWNYGEILQYGNLKQRLMGGDAVEAVRELLALGFILMVIYGIWYLSIRFIRPVFSLGLKEYIKQYSFVYQIFPWLKKQWNKFKYEVEHIDFQKGSTKTIIKIVAINFVVLAIISSLWFFGVFVLIIYSVILFIFIDNYYRKVEFHYKALLRGVNKIAEGDLETEIPEDLGMFEPFKGELGKIRHGFKKAVDDEVKSQRMKTELITNVSHDLKTPLTAITTYVELLKKEDITEEERRSYIETLEKKSLRLKVLIEDLFEVSKATSNNISFEYMDVDVVNLMKQVAIEHADKFAAAGLDLRWNVPEEKTILRLDNQKTYRIFENLFVNIQKYAMPNSRVYVEVKKIPSDSEVLQENGTVMGSMTEDGIAKKGIVEIVIKNMSATELNFAAEEITERFVRGDASRNTEGSGLGLAIAKSFAEGQGGTFHVEVDGDLFKVVIRWRYGMIYT